MTNETISIPLSLERQPIDKEIALALGSSTVNEMSARWFDNSEAARHVVSGMASHSGLLEGDVDTMGYQRGYMVSELPTALPISTRTQQLPEDHTTMQRWSEMDADTKAKYAYFSSRDFNSDMVKFDSLRPEVKETLLTNRLFDIHSKSQDPGEKQLATSRNYSRSIERKYIKSTDLTHTTRSENLPAILNNGLVAVELLGKTSDGSSPITDRYPFNLDLSKLSNVPEKFDADNYKECFRHVVAYGDIFIVVDRSEESTDFGKEVGDSDFKKEGHGAHVLIFGGVPSTEIAAVCISPLPDSSANDPEALFNAEQTTLFVKDAIINHGQYIPVINHKGEFILSKEEFDFRRSMSDYGNFTRQKYIGPTEVDQYALPEPEAMF